MFGTEGSGETGTGVEALQSLGLVDPRGNAVPTDDWSGPEGNPPGDNSSERRAPAGQQQSTPADGQQSPAQTQQQQPAGQAQINWDDPSNPYRPDPVQQSRQTYENAVRQLDAERPVALQTLIQSGMDPRAAQAAVDGLYQTGVANARIAADRVASLPVVKEMAARDIATKFSTDAVKIDPTELTNESTVEAMQAKARTIVNERRNQTVAGRQQSGADRVERAGSGARVDYSSLSPHAMITLGLRRGQ